MRSAVRFLTAMAQALSTMSLYREGHPSREKALDLAHERVHDLQEEDPTPVFTFLKGEVVLGDRPLWDLKEWEWAERLAGIGVERLELTGPVGRDELEGFLEEVFGRLSGHPPPTDEARYMRPANIRYGLARMRGDEGWEAEEGEPRDEELATATLGFTFEEEAETVRWLHEELKERGQLHLLEAEAIVRSLAVAMHGEQEFLIPLLQLKRFDQYTTTHALNVSVLSMSLAEHIGLTRREVRAFGMSGLLHDLGKTRVPEEILNKPGKLTDEEMNVMKSHTVEGARIILDSDHHLDLAAVVAYEHHIRIDGGGYPDLSYPRRCHQCSNLVHVCDVFDALRTRRPYREAWEEDRVLEYIAEGAGTEFDGELARAFLEMMEQWGTRVRVLEDERESLPLAEEDDGEPLPLEEEDEEGGA